jgi:hypothetical protein
MTYLTGFPEMIGPSKGDYWRERLAIEIIKQREPFDLRIRVTHMAGANFKFEDVEDVFGKSWKNRPAGVLPSEPFNKSAPKALPPHGDKKIDYSFVVTPSINSKVAVDFDYNGNCAGVEIQARDISAIDSPTILLDPLAPPK